jgi:hypothetical protein
MSNRFEEIYDWAGLLVRDYVRTHHDESARVLDVGAGQGKYRILLHDMPNFDACEVWEPTVRSEQLWDLYRDVFVHDVVDLVTSASWGDVLRYDLVIMGDVLEHLDRDGARLVLDRIAATEADVIVIVPYSYPQGEEDGNVYQRHIQDDLTPELMAAEYPNLRLLALETRDWKPFKGLYVWSISE